MKSTTKEYCFASLVLCSLLCLLASLAGAQTSPSGKRLLGYYPEWSKFNNPPYVYSADQIPYYQLTHIAHAFVLLTAKADGTLHVPYRYLEPALISKAHTAGVKVLVSIGGGDGIQGPRFNKMARSETSRQAFVKNVHTFLSANGYDGVDIDWEIPNGEDTSDCTTLMQELRNELPAGQWIITMASPSDPPSYGVGFDIPALAPLVDFFNVMTYDDTGSWAGYAGLNSPLLQDLNDPIQSGSVKTSMDLYANTYGVPLSQLNMGFAFYGYEFDGVDTLWAACGACAVNQQNYGDYIKPLMRSSDWQKELDVAARSPYMVNSTLPGFISYDNVSSTAAKTKYVMKRRDFGGVFMWELSADYDGKSQDLMDAMYKEWVAAQ